MTPPVFDAMRGIQSSFEGFQYISDHLECFRILCDKVRHGVRGRIIFEETQFYNCSCTRQPARIRSLLEAGGEARTYRPGNGGFACMHAKTWLLDGSVVLTGSVNLTENGFERNYEHM